MGAVVNKILFQPPDPPHPVDKKIRIKWCKCKNEEGDIEIPIVFLRHKSSDLCVLHSHGNATDLGQMIPYLQLFRSAFKINVCAYEYQGYGLSRPNITPTEERVYESVERAMKFLTEDKGIPPHKIILFGTSLGSGPSIYISSRYKVRGLVLQSGFMSVLRTRFNFPSLVGKFDMFENWKRVKNIECPVFVIHGKRDDLVPYYHGRDIFENSKNKFEPLFLEDAGHNNIIDSCGISDYLKRIYEYIIYLNKFWTKKEKGGGISKVVEKRGGSASDIIEEIIEEEPQPEPEPEKKKVVVKKEVVKRKEEKVVETKEKVKEESEEEEEVEESGESEEEEGEGESEEEEEEDSAGEEVKTEESLKVEKKENVEEKKKVEKEEDDEEEEDDDDDEEEEGESEEEGETESEEEEGESEK